MKKLSSLLVALVVGSIIYAQTPAGFSYQAVLRNTSGQVLGSQAAQLRVSLISSNGVTTHYQEVHDVTSTAQGLINVIIGGGIVMQGVLADVPWGNDQITMKTEIKVGSAADFTLLGTQPLQAVPYALYANNAKEVESSPAAGDDDPIFVVKNRLGQIVFAVYQEGVRVFVDDGTTKGTKGGFAVGGLSGTKASVEYFRITPDSARVWVNNVTKGAKGGFAVGGLSGVKAEASNYMYLTPNNYLIGQDAGKSLTTGLYNSFMGYEAGKASTTSEKNVLVGYRAGLSVTEGNSNVILGNQAGQFAKKISSSILIGDQAGEGYTYSEFANNVAIGYRAGYNLTTGYNNVFMGNMTGFFNKDGSFNVFIGNLSGYSNTSGTSNVFLGECSGYSNTTGGNNLFSGTRAGYFNTTGENNLFSGSSAGYYNTTGVNNVFMGNMSGMSNTTGFSNVFIGNEAGKSNTLGKHNVFIGEKAGYNNIGTSSEYSGSKGIFIGFEAGYSNTTGSHNLLIGENAGRANTTGGQNIFIGLGAGVSNTLEGGLTFIGTNAGGKYNGPYTGASGVNGTLFLGDNSGYDWIDGRGNTILNSYAWGVKHGENNIFIGRQVPQLGETVNNTLLIDYLIYGDLYNKRMVIKGTNTDNINNLNFFVNGTAGGTSAWSSPSDGRLKTNVKPLDGALQKVMQLNGVTFNWKDETNYRKGQNIGFIAQDVLKVLPQVVSGGGKDENGKEIYYSVEYATVVPVLVEAIKEQQKLIEQQQKEFNLLKNELEAIKKLLSK